MYCSPSHNGLSNYTCYTRDELARIAKYYNESQKKAGIKVKINNRSKQQLWKDLYKAFGDRCKDESCWIEKPTIKKAIPVSEAEIFRPKMPKDWKKDNYTTWLSNIDIDKIMEQYQEKYPNFLYLKAVPSDCLQDGALQCPLKNFNIATAYKNGYRYIAQVRNNMNSRSSGQHWWAWFADLGGKGGKTAKFSFFDSYGSEIPKDIMHNFEIFADDLAKIGIKSKIDRNHVPKQRDNYSCSTYSIYFIVKMLEGKTLRQIEKMNLPTEKMQKFKLSIFRPADR